MSASASRKGGGVAESARAHAIQLARHGFDVRVEAVSDAYARSEASSWSPADVSLHDPVFARFGYAPGLWQRLRAGDFDLLHQHGLWQYPSIAVSRARLLSRAKLVVSTHGMLEPWALAQSRFRKRLAAALFERANLSAADCLHCTPLEVPGIRDFGLTNPLAVISNGTDQPPPTSDLPPPPWDRDELRKTLLFLGRLHPKKGIRETLDGWAMLCKAQPTIAETWKLVIAGWGEPGYAAQVRDWAREMAIGNVHVPGPVHGASKEGAFAHASAFILASHSEGMPMAVLEAWAHGLPVFMTRECNLPAGFEAKAAIEVTTDPPALARTLGAWLAKPELADVGERGRRLARDVYSWDQVGDRLNVLYRWLLGEGPRPDFVDMR